MARSSGCWSGRRVPERDTVRQPIHQPGGGLGLGVLARAILPRRRRPRRVRATPAGGRAGVGFEGGDVHHCPPDRLAVAINRIGLRPGPPASTMVVSTGSRSPSGHRQIVSLSTLLDQPAVDVDGPRSAVIRTSRPPSREDQSGGDAEPREHPGRIRDALPAAATRRHDRAWRRVVLESSRG